jgi:hypothetical protein
LSFGLAAFDESSGLCNTPMRWTVGNTSMSISTCFSHISEIISDMPVRFAPGSVRLRTSFEYTGSPTKANTTGIDAVAFCAAVAAGVPEVQIRSTLALTSSRAYCSNLSMSLHSDPGPSVFERGLVPDEARRIMANVASYRSVSWQARIAPKSGESYAKSARRFFAVALLALPPLAPVAAIAKYVDTGKTYHVTAITTTGSELNWAAMS